MNSSLVPSTGNNSNSCMERYVNRYVVHQQPPPPPHHPVHSQLRVADPGSSSVAGSAVAAGYYHQTPSIHSHHQHHPHNHLQQQQQQQQPQNQFIPLPAHTHSVQHPNPSVPVTPLAHQPGTTGNHGASSNYMVGCYGGGGSVGTNGWTGVPLISTASGNRRHRKHFTGSSVANNGNHYPYQPHLTQQQQHYNLSKGTSSGTEFDENANLTRLALHAHGAPLILSNSNRYHHGHHRNHKSSSGAAHQTTGSGVGSAKAVTIASAQIQPETSTNYSTRSPTQLPHPGQRRQLDAHSTIVGAAGGQSGGGVIKSYEAAASLDLIPPNGNTSSPSTVMSGSAMSSSVSSSSSSTSSTSSTTSSASTEMCLPRIIKPRKRRKKDRKPNAQTTIGCSSNGGTMPAGNGTDSELCDRARNACAAGSLPCLESHLLNVGGSSNVHTVHNILLQHQQSPLHCGTTSMHPVGGVANVRDILSELSYIASHNPSVLFPERLTVELAKFLASSNVPAARYQSVAQQQQQQPPPQQQYSQLHSMLLQLQQHQHQLQQQQQLDHQRLLYAQQQNLPSQQDPHRQLLVQQHHQPQFVTHAQIPQQQQQTVDQLLPQLNTTFGSVNDSINFTHRPQTVPSGFFFPSSDMNTVLEEPTSAQVSSSSSHSTLVSLPEPASPSASSNCSCRLCDPFGRIWAFPMLRHSSCSAGDGFESEGRKKNVGVIGSNRNSGTALRGTWSNSADSVSFATLNIGETPDGCLSRKGSFSDSGSDSGCDLLLSRLPGLCSTEEEEEDDEEEEHEDRIDCVAEGEESDSLLSSAQGGTKTFAEHYRDFPWLGAIVGHPVTSSKVSSCSRKTNNEELLLMSELTKKLHETLDLVGEAGSSHTSSRIQKEGDGVMAPRSGSCSSSSSTSDNSSGMGSFIGGDSASLSLPSEAFVSFDEMSRNNMFGGKGSVGQRLLMGSDRLFAAGNECLVMDESDMRASEMSKCSATNAYPMVPFKRSIASPKCESNEGGVVPVANGGCVSEDGNDVLQESNIVECAKRNPLSLRPISVVGSLFSVNQPTSALSGSSSWIGNTTGIGGSSCLFGGEQQLLEQHQLHRQPSTAGDMLNCFDTFWSGGDHKQLLPAEK